VVLFTFLQILKNNHWCLVVRLIQSQIDDLNCFYDGEPLSENTHIDDDDNGDEIGDITGFE
jgi:hypothetical protein